MHFHFRCCSFHLHWFHLSLFYIFHIHGVFSLFCNFLNIWNMVIITDLASLSASCDIRVNSGSASIGWLFSSLWVVSSCCFVWLVIFYWIPGIMTFTLRHGENVCIPYEYSWALFWDVVKSLRNSLRLSSLALLICWAGLVQFSILKLVSATEAWLSWVGYRMPRGLSLSSLAGGNRQCSRLRSKLFLWSFPGGSFPGFE